MQGISLLELLFVGSFAAWGLAMAVLLLATGLSAPRAEGSPAKAAHAPDPRGALLSATFRDRLDVVVYAGLGGFACFCFYQGLFGPHGLVTHPEVKEIATLVVLLVLAVWIEIQFIHPRLERRSAEGGLELHPPGHRHRRWDVRGTLVLALVFAVMDLVQHFAHKDLKYILASVGCAGITWFWVWGAGTRRGRPVILGGAGGWALGMAGAAAVFYLLHGGLVRDPSLRADDFLPSGDARAFLLFILLFILGGGLFCGFCGAAGGALLALLRSGAPTRRRTALAGALGGAAVYLFFDSAAFALGYAGVLPTLPASHVVPEAGLGAVDLRIMAVSILQMDLLGGALYGAALGGLGGLWIDRSRSRRPMTGLLIVFPLVILCNSAAQIALGFGAQWIVLGEAFWGTVHPAALLLDFGAGLAVLLGWALGLVLCPSADLVLGRRAGPFSLPTIGRAAG